MKNKEVFFFTPFYRQNRGNSTTARRIINGLRRASITVTVFAYEEESWDASWDDRFKKASLYHVIHLRRFAEWLKKHPHLLLTKPYILTSGGTDVNEDLKNRDAVKLIKSVTDHSCAITVFSEDGRDKIIKAYPQLIDDVYVIAQSVWLPESIDYAPIVREGYPKLLLPAGLRPVKDVLFLLDELVNMRETWPQLTYSIIGVALDEEVAKEVKRYEAKYEWFHYLEAVALEQMKNVYAGFDIVLNTSISEGQPISLLEAMYVGKPVVARRIPGNESIVTHRKTGLLFESASECHQLIKELLRDQEWRTDICKTAKEYVDVHHSIEGEIKQILKVYDHCLVKEQT